MNPKIAKLAAAVLKYHRLKSVAIPVSIVDNGVSLVFDLGEFGAYAADVSGLPFNFGFSVTLEQLQAVAKEKSLVWTVAGDKLVCRGSSGLTGTWDKEEPIKYRHSSADGATIMVKAKEFVQELAAAHVAACNEKDRAVLKCVYLEQDSGQLRIVATDGRRLRIRDTGWHLGAEWSGAIVDYKSQKAIWLAIAAIGGDVLLRRYDDNGGAPMLSLSGPGYSFSIRLVEGTWPNYRQVVPSGAASNADFECSSMIAAAELFARTKPEDRSICFDGLRAFATPEAGKPDFSVDCRIPEIAAESARLLANAATKAQRFKDLGYSGTLEELTAKVQKGARAVAFNPEFLADAEPCNRCWLSDGFFGPAVFKTDGLQYILMPKRF